MSTKRGEGHSDAVVVFQNVNALSLFMYARDGFVIRKFDPLCANAAPENGDPLPQEAGIEFPGSRNELHPMPAAFLLAERLTGVRLTASDLTEPGDRIAVGIHP